MQHKDLKIDLYKATGAGGQHINTTDSAVRIKHLPTSVTVTQAQKSQHKNKEKALKILKLKLLKMKLNKQNKKNYYFKKKTN